MTPENIDNLIGLTGYICFLLAICFVVYRNKE